MTKEMFLGLVAAAAALPLAAAEGNMIEGMTQNEGMTAVPRVSPVTIDGNLDEWDFSGEIWSFADYEMRDQYSVRTAAMWDEEYLYLSFRWKDPLPLNSTVNPEDVSQRPEGWRADAVQLRIAPPKGNPLWVTSWWYKDRATLQFMYWEFPQKFGKMESAYYVAKPNGIDLGEGIQSVYRMLPARDGFVQEMRLPWRVLLKQKGRPMPTDAALKAGDKLRMTFEFKWGDASGSGWPMHAFSDNLQPGNTERSFLWGKSNAWGDFILGSAALAEKRRYVPKVYKPEGVCPVRVKVPAEAKVFTVVIEDKDGNRVRNLAGGFDVNGYRVDDTTGEVKWDLLDDAGNPVPEGEYRVRGLTHQGLTSSYVMSFYNPGTPPWTTLDTRGAWGSDHSRIQFAARAGKDILLSGGFVEGGYGVFSMGPNDRKNWSHPRGAMALAANDRYVFVMPNGWHTKDEVLCRYDAKTGEARPFILDGKPRPQDLPLTEIFGRKLKRLVDRETSSAQWGLDKNQNVLGFTAGPASMVVALADGIVVELDQETAQVKGEHKLDYDYALVRNVGLTAQGTPFDQVFTPIVFDGTRIFFYRKGVLCEYALADGTTRTIETTEKVERPTAMALGDDGSIYVADDGADKQVKRFGRNGTLLATYGKKGGRARAGKFDAQGMREVSSIAVDAKGRVWTVEFTDFPRRVSVWGTNGKLDKDFIGNTGYCGSGVVLHPQDVGRAFVGPNEFLLDETNHTAKMERVLVNPKFDDMTFPLTMAANKAGHVFRSSASGVARDYFFRDGILYMGDAKGDWRCVAAATTVGRIQKLFRHHIVIKEPHGDFAGRNAFDIAVWNDLDGDGLASHAECEILPNPFAYKIGERMRWPRPQLRAGWGSRMDVEDLSFFVSDGKCRWKLVPTSFGPDGAPRYSLKDMTVVSKEPLIESEDMYPVPGEDTLLTFTRKAKRGVVMGVTKDFKQVKWTYPDRYDNVHGSHSATMPRPGLLIGPLKIAGVVEACGDAKGVFMLRGNYGSDYYLTTDGLYVDSMFKDMRLPSLTLPATEDELRAAPFHLYSMGAEPFNGWIGRQSDGQVRMLCGVAPQAACLAKIHGLETIRYFTGDALSVDAALLARAKDDREARARGASAAKTYTIARVTGDRPQWEKISAMPIAAEGQPVQGECRLAHDGRKLFVRFTVKGDASPWMNRGKDMTRLFKSGDCVDLCLSPSANKGKEAKEGDLRLLVAPFGKDSVSVLMRKVCAQARPEERVHYRSPVRAFDMAQVKAAAKPTVSVGAKGYAVELEIPWSELGVTPTSGLKMRGDVGLILSDAAGAFNTARVYFSNKETGLVSDLPGEADLYPSQWADITLE